MLVNALNAAAADIFKHVGTVDRLTHINDNKYKVVK
jgi:hypothetical protein